MKNVVDLFAGCGGLSLGFQNAGFQIKAAFEYWSVAANCYEQNFPHPVYTDDLSETALAINKIKEINPDIIIGGPPCQDFSHAGKRIEDKRAGLTEIFAQIIAEISPQWFVMENVDRAQKSVAYASARKIFKEAGYGLTETVLDASHCGTPQKRKRFFCIGSMGNFDSFLSEYIQAHLSANPTTVRDYFGNTLDIEYYYRHPRNYCRRAIYSIDEPAPTVRGMNRPVPPGYPGHPGDACELNGAIRALTTLERALLQTFPADFKWIGNKTDTEQMIGNAVPVKLAEFVAKALAYHIDEHEMNCCVDYNKFLQWIGRTQTFSEKTKRDVVSRLKRVESICALPFAPDTYYLFQLEQSAKFKELATTVRSQMKRAVTLYFDYCAAEKPAYANKAV
ncbi:MAG: DNA cytosine methyltransferase [Lachnospiraceae bacterium]|jgi:DNA (cytosine-5)-methyltransferase 1|nr:DNA cytosine methyltransferase [Lachnospiraceae bacterium]